MRARGLVAALLLPLALAGAAAAQIAPTLGTVRGHVHDRAGAPVPALTVTLTLLDRNLAQRQTTDAAGGFAFPAVAVGDYDLAIATDGAAAWHRTFRVAVGSVVELDPVLDVAVAEAVQVTAEAPRVETTRTQVATVITPEEVRDLPLNGRNYLDLALLTPGASRTNTGANQRFAETSAVPGTGLSVSSQRNLANTFLVDGLSANDDAAELAGTFFSQEVIREFAVVRSAGVAEFGRAASGIVTIATNSGTNALRGDAYLFSRNDALDADNALSRSRAPLDQKQYGASLGGALVRDRSFFFANVERMDQDTGTLVTIAPATVDAVNRRLDQVAYAGDRLRTGFADATLRSTNLFARVDHALAPERQLTVRLNTYDVTSSNARSVGGLNAPSRGTSLANRDRTLAAQYLWTVSDHLLSETRAQATRSRLEAPPNDETGPAVTIAGVANLGTATSSPTARDIDLAELVQTLTWVGTRHAAKIGVDLLRNEVAIEFPGALQGVYSFPSLAAFLAGSYSSYQQAFGERGTRQTNGNLGAFVQDEWRIGPRLTVNAGLRYDLQRLPAPIRDDADNVSPRLGLAFDPQGDGRSVLRGSAGLFYGPVPLRAVANALQRDGVRYRVAQVAPSFPGAPKFPGRFDAYPTGVLTNVTTIDPDIASSDTVQASLQYERQLGAALSAAVAVETLRGRHIVLSRNVNAPTTADPAVPNRGGPDPRFANNSQYQSIGDSWYRAVTLQLERRRTAHASFRLAYTYSKSEDTAGNFFFSQPQDANDVAAERGRSDNDQRHRVTLSGTLASTPAAGGAVVQALTRGWLLSYAFSYASALPFNIQLPNDRNGDTNFNDRPAGVKRNAGHGFDYQSLDLRLSRGFDVAGRGVELLVDVFNVLDRANYQVPNNILGSPTFGRPTAASDPRLVQLGIRLSL